MNRVLLLNASYTPLYVIPPERACCLLLDGVALPTDEPIAKTFRSPSITVEVPSVIVLRRFVNVPRRTAAWSRSAVLARDGYRCAYCGARVGDVRRDGRIVTYSDFNVDHVVPRSAGGMSVWHNTVSSCRWCNARKGSRRLSDVGMHTLWEPKKPRINYVVVRGNVPEPWRKYLEV